MHIIPSETLVGPSDKIPGLKTTALSARFGGFDEALIFNDRKTLYAHNIRITSMNEIEANFSQYLRILCMHDPTIVMRAQILERKLTVVPHNTWKQIG